MKFLFICTGNGELAYAKPLIRKVQKEGHQAILMISANAVPLMRAEKVTDIDIEVFKFDDYDIFGRLTVLCQFYKIDIVVTSPSRGWLANWKRPEGVKLVVTLEANLQFRGVGNSYRLDRVFPEWVDLYLVPWHPELLKRALFTHYGIDSLDGYPELESKVKAIGWVPSEQQKHLENSEQYSMSYFGNSNTMNEGLIQKLADAYFQVEKERGLISVGNDIVTGNFPKLEIYPAIKDYDGVLANAREAYLHEGYGSIIKCIVNMTPVFSFCAKTPIKQMEIQPLADLGLIYKYDKPADSGDIEGLKEEIQKFREQRTSLRNKMREYQMDGGEDNFYKLIMERV